MGSEDDYHKNHPEVNAWLEVESGDPARLSATETPVRKPGTSRTVMSAQIQRLARLLGRDPEDLAASIPPDTIRRTKYPVRESVQSDGTVLFEHDLGITEGPRGLIHR